MEKFSLMIIFTFIFLLVITYQNVNAIEHQTLDQISCNNLGGNWFSPNSCVIDTLVILDGTILKITSKVILKIESSLHNTGYIHNQGIIIIENDAEVINDSGGIIITKDEGILSNKGSMYIKKGGVLQIISGGHFENVAGGQFYNDGGILNNQGKITNHFGSNFTNNAQGILVNKKMGIIINGVDNPDIGIDVSYFTNAGHIVNFDGGKIINKHDAEILNVFGSTLSNGHGGYIVISGGKLSNYGTISNEGIIFNDGGEIHNIVADHGDDTFENAFINNKKNGVIFNNRGIFFNWFSIINNEEGALIFNNEKASIGNIRGFINNFSKFVNDCGGIIINQGLIKQDVINIPCDDDSNTPKI